MNNKELLVSILDPLIFHEMAYLGAKGGPSTLDITVAYKLRDVLNRWGRRLIDRPEQIVINDRLYLAAKEIAVAIAVLSFLPGGISLLGTHWVGVDRFLVGNYMETNFGRPSIPSEFINGELSASRPKKRVKPKGFGQTKPLPVPNSQEESWIVTPEESPEGFIVSVSEEIVFAQPNDEVDVIMPVAEAHVLQENAHHALLPCLELNSIPDNNNSWTNI